MSRKQLIIYGCMCILSLNMHAQSKEDGMRKLAYSWIDALNRHDTDAIAKMYADNAQLESPNWEGIKTGAPEAKTVYHRYFTSTPDLQQQITHLVVTDSNIVVEYISTGTLQNPEKNTPEYMRGKKYTLHNCTRLNIDHGKIIMQVNYFDQVAFLRQVGFF